MNTQAEKFNALQLKKMPDVKPGDTVKVHQTIKEEAPSASSGSAKSKGSGQAKERIQVFEGVVIARKHGKGILATITVRKVIKGVGVERIFPIHSPFINKIEVVKSGKVRRAKLYYLRHAKGKKAKLKKKDFATAISPEEHPIMETPEPLPQEKPTPEGI